MKLVSTNKKGVLQLKWFVCLKMMCTHESDLCPLSMKMVCTHEYGIYKKLRDIEQEHMGALFIKSFLSVNLKQVLIQIILISNTV